MSQRDESGLPMEGDYDAVVRTTELKEQNDKLFLEVGLELKVDDQDFPIYGRIYLTEKAAGIARGSMRSIGWDPDQDPIKLHEEPMTLNGNKTRVSLKHWVNAKGEVVPQIKQFLPVRMKLDEGLKARLSSVATAIKDAKKE